MLFGLLSLLLGQLFANSVVPIGTKIAAPFTGPLLFVFLRFVVATALLFFLYLFSQKKKLTIHDYKDFAFLGFLLCINVLFFTIGIAYTTVIMSTLLYSLTPLLVGIGGHFLLKEAFTKQKILGLIISFVGLLFLLSHSFSGHQEKAFGQPLGNMLLCIGVLSYSYYVIHSRKVLHGKNQAALQTTFLTFTFTTLFLLVVLLVGVALGQVSIKHLSSAAVAGFLIVGVGTIAQYLFLQIGVKQTNAFISSLFQYTGPFIAASITIPLLHEQVTPQLVIGGLLLLAGVFIATTYSQFKKRFIK